MLLLLGTATAFAEEASPLSIFAQPLQKPWSDSRGPGAPIYLTYREGYELSGDRKDFGGISALRFTKDEARVVFVTDRGDLITASFGERAGKLALRDAYLTPLLSTRGKRLKGREGDAEALALKGNRAWVGFERINRIARFEFNGRQALGRSHLIPLPKADFDLGNHGIEGLDLLPGSTVKAPRFLISLEGDLWGEYRKLWVVEPKKRWSFQIHRAGLYRPTELAVLPDGSFLVLERYLNPLNITFPSRIRFFPAQRITPGARLKGQVIFKAETEGRLENLEGMALRQTFEGGWILTLISDDNFASIQKTVWLDFAFDLEKLLSDASRSPDGAKANE